MKIRVIIPVISCEAVDATRSLYAAAARSDAEISVVCLAKGPASIESDYEEAMAVSDLLAPVIDPGVAAVKLAERLVDMKLAHSKRTYPPPKEIVAA